MGTYVFIYKAFSQHQQFVIIFEFIASSFTWNPDIWLSQSHALELNL